MTPTPGTNPPPPTYTTAAALFGSWLGEVERGEPPVRFVLPPPSPRWTFAPVAC